VLVLLCVHAVLLSASVATTEPNFELPRVAFEDVLSQDESTSIFVAHQLVSLGALQITGIPQFAAARAEALRNAATCLAEEAGPVVAGMSGGVATVRMADGSTRRTIAAARDKSGHSTPMSSARCGEPAATLRSLVDISARQLFLSLDRAVHSHHGVKTHAEASSEANVLLKPAYDSFEQIGRLGGHLEHLHVYYMPSNGTQRVHLPSTYRRVGRTLPMHTDSGMFVVMTTGLVQFDEDEGSEERTGKSAAENELYLQLPGGVVARAEADEDALLVLAGEGAAEWLHPVLGGKIRAMPHALGGERRVGRQRTRAWFGLMVLPPPMALIPVVHSINYGTESVEFIPYRAYREREIASAKDAAEFLPAACMTAQWLGEASAHKRKLRNSLCTLADGSSGVMCWTQCQPVEKLSCGTSAVCRDVVSNEDVDGGECFSQGGMSKCQLVCPEAKSADQDSPSGAARSSFCRGGGVDMHMGGFTSALASLDGSAECLCLFFASWKLDTRLKFVMGCVSVFLLGALIEYCTSLRRELFKQKLSRRREVFALCLHCVQLALAYLVMLAAMTYSVELFIMVLAGLTVGHGLFNLRAPPPLSTDPCCPESGADMQLMMNDDDFDHDGELALVGRPPGRNSQEYQKIT